MKHARISPITKLAVVIYCLGSDLRALLRYRITWPVPRASMNTNTEARPNSVVSKPATTATAERTRSVAKSIHKTLNTRPIRLHSPQALAGFTILTAFLVWVTLANVPIRHYEHNLLLPEAEISPKLKEDKAPGAKEPARFPNENSTSSPPDTPVVPVTAPPVIVPAADERKPDLSSDAQPGETTMTNYLRNGTLHAALLGWLFGAPFVPAFADDKPPAPGEPTDRLQKIERNLNDLKLEVQKLQDNSKAVTGPEFLKPLRDDVAQLKTDVDRLKQDPKKVEVRKPIADENTKGFDSPPQPSDLPERVKRLELALENVPQVAQARARDLVQMRNDIDQLRRDVTHLQQELDRERTRISRYPPAAGGEGRIRIVNSWFEAKTVVLDGVAYRVAPGETRVINHPAGTFAFEVIGVTQPGQTRTVTAGETYSIHIGPSQGQ